MRGSPYVRPGYGSVIVQDARARGPKSVEEQVREGEGEGEGEGGKARERRSERATVATVVSRHLI